MYLKSIEVYGFKSFANKITFEFQHGITGIVGPNGSGKSNVADAVRWVLGEQSAKQLRGAKMEDVIFSGTESRKPLGSAYVAITLDNSDKSLPIDYEEVTIARRVYRSGESEYLINGTACRLKDVHALFFDTGIGKEGYSIIGQGQIDRILSGKPEERRELFDEAAGIVKYKKNKMATEKSLESEKQNLYRVNDILAELEVQVGPLREQSMVAKEYLVYKDQLKQLDVNVFLLEHKRLKDHLTELNGKINHANEEMKETNIQYDSTKAEYEKLELQIESANQKIEEIKNQITDIRLHKEKAEGEVKVFYEQINTAKSNEEHMRSSVNRIENELTQKAEELAKLEEERADFDKQLQDWKIQKEDLRIQVEKKNQEITDLLEEIETQKANIISFMNESASIKGKLQRYDTMLEQIQLRKIELNQRLLKSKSDEAVLSEELTEQKDKQKTIEESLTALSLEISKNDQKRQDNHEHSRKNTASINDLQRKYHQSKSKLDTLKNLTERYEGYGNSIRRVMEKKKDQPGIHGVVADIIKVKKEYEIAVETALGGSIQNIVTDNEQTAKSLIEYLKQNRYGRATFLPLTSITNRNTFYNEKALTEPGVIGLASELVETDARYQTLTEYLLGRIVVVDHINNAITLAKKYRYSMRIVTIEGESLNPGGAMTGGAFRNNSNLLGRRRELEELDDQIKGYVSVITSATELDAKLQKEREVLKTAGEELDKKRQELSIQENTNRLKLSEVQNKLTEIQNAFGSLKKENDELEQQIREIRVSKDQLDEGNQEQENSKAACEEKIKQLEEKLILLKEEEKHLQEEFSKVNLEHSGLLQKKEFHTINVSRITGEKEKLTGELKGIISDNGSVEQEIDTILSKIKNIQDTIESNEEQIKEKESILAEFEKSKDEITKNHKEFFSKREELSSHLNRLDKEIYRLSSQNEKTQENIDQLVQYMWDEYEITYNNALGMRDENLVNLSEMKKELSGIKNSIRNLGDVNVNAIEDYKNVSERFEFLQTQRDDILKAEENLKQIIEELDTAMRAQFNEKFAEIQIMFDKVFKELFGGGKASLHLVEDEDVLEAGISIISQPPGKKLQNMMQLSGGEKALTAIALLFAIQSLKPSPFCLLDEIEAALDDSNVVRFAQYLHKLTKDTQFIVITHRRGTMVAADILYGITMQEKGISTLVSVNLIENELDK